MPETILLDWVRERFKLHLAAPLVAALCGIAGLTGTWPGSGRFVATVVLATLLLAQFRLWDDLADVEADRKSHPERTLPRAASLRPFRDALLWLAGITAGIIVLLDPSGLKLAVLAALDLALAGWYRFRPREYSLGYHVVLLKYPVFVYLLSSEPVHLQRRMFAMTAVYLAACIYEALHDPRLRGIWAARYAVVVEAALLGGTLVLGGRS